MARITTYVFIDLETTGLPSEECNRTKITELSMVAVKRSHLLDTRPGSTPRVQHKLTLCLNPRRRITCIATDTTGLCNDLLESEPVFNHDVFNMINTFVSVLSKPVCLIAQNGLGFDYPILKNHLAKLNVSFSEDLLCADCYHGFYDILEKNKHDMKVFIQDTKIDRSPDQLSEVSQIDSSTVKQKSNAASSSSNGENSSRNGENSPSNATPMKEETISPKNGTKSSITEACESPSSSKTSVDDFYTVNTKMQAINETTPKRKITEPFITKISKVRRRMPWGCGPKPRESYKLKNIYERVLQRPSLEAHRAEIDCIMALQVSAALSKKFVDWVDENHVYFSDIKPMTIGEHL